MTTQQQHDQNAVIRKSPRRKSRVKLLAVGMGLSGCVAVGALAAGHKEMTAKLTAGAMEALSQYLPSDTAHVVTTAQASWRGISEALSSHLFPNGTETAAVATPVATPVKTAQTSREGNATAKTPPAPSASDTKSPAAAQTGVKRVVVENAVAAHPAGKPLGIGDRMKIVFYERIDTEEDKWGRATSALRGVQQRPELSGDYTVSDDGTITVPLLGSVKVAGLTSGEIQKALSESFGDILGRNGLVNILSVERSPIYVLGPVKNPGSFKYVPGLTVLHALSLAGGLERSGGMEPWQKMEAVREVEKRSGAELTMLKLLARGAVLRAERDGETPKIPLKLIEFVGAGEARKLITDQGQRRRAISQNRHNRELAIAATLDAERQALDMMKGRIGPIEELVRLRQDRVSSLKTLVNKAILSNTVLNQAQSELSDAEQRRQDAINQYSMAQQRVSALEQEANRILTENKSDLQTEIDTIERSLSDSERELNTSQGVLSALKATRTTLGNPTDKGVTYEIVRQTAAGPVSIISDGMTVLQPGDLVNVSPNVAAEGEEAVPSEPGSAMPTSDRAEGTMPLIPTRPRT